MQTIARHRNDVPDAKDPMVAKLMSDLAAELPGEVERHFAFEEAELFPYLSEAGNHGIGAHLTHEHSIIRLIGVALVKLIGDVRAQGFDAARWTEFRRLGQQLNDRFVRRTASSPTPTGTKRKRNCSPNTSSCTVELCISITAFAKSYTRSTPPSSPCLSG